MSPDKTAEVSLDDKPEKHQNFWSRATTIRSAWDDKDQFLDVIYWSRQVIALIIGVICGIVPISGFVGISLFLLMNTVFLYFYFYDFQRLEEFEFEGFWELNKEGFMTSFATFMMVWIIFYTGFQFV